MDLTSHHVNYLIWRYLQESGHGDAAVTLQRAWIPNPQNLPFASHIKTHALVSLVQKGLQYHEIEQSLDQDGNPVPFTPSKYFFGPSPFDPDSLRSREEYGQVNGGISPNIVAPSSPGDKPIRDSATVNGHLAVESTIPVLNVKKGRKADRPETIINGEDGAMEIDSNGAAHDRISATPALKSPSPGDTLDANGDVDMNLEPSAEPELDEQERLTYTLTTGKSVGVQIVPAKAADLTSNTLIIDLNIPRNDHVMRCAWRPNDPSMFAAAGDSFCDLWKVPSPASSTSPTCEKIYDSKGDGSWVTALAWEPSGRKLAVATYNERRSSIQMYDSSGNVVDLLPTAQGMINGLYWAPNNPYIVVVASNGENSELSLWDDSIKPEEYPPYQAIDGLVHDITWAGDNKVFASGEGLVWQCEIDSSIHIVNKFESQNTNTEWSFIRGGQRGSAAVAVAAASSVATLWIPTHDILVEDAHRADITAIELQPEPQGQNVQMSTSFVFASASIDDTVKVWDVNLETKKITCLHTLFLSPGVPALALAFSPDGYLVSAASTDRLFIWNTERGGEPLATWAASSSPTVKEEGLEKTNGENGSRETPTYRSLSWDTDGKKLIMGFGKKMAIISPQGRTLNASD
ncbi:WD repeat protein [Talaromyces proteolyticus]|uniref:WD repeat protein n=1 Tax=Talaromyces proteolyticus TaxID=1131652 RepID=A0AAD4KWF6_9EURO|nr:WD repeat protein [Talaromyces proteolyticus]KAH8701679.1 WD repeat protein [Talaromyces proteolyticus]